MKIRCLPPARGHFIVPCTLPRGTPDQLTAVDGRAIWQPIRDEPSGRVGYLSAWSDTVIDGVIEMREGSKVFGVLHPRMESLLYNLHLSQLRFPDQTIKSISNGWQFAEVATGYVATNKVKMVNRVVDIEILFFWSVPWALAMIGASRTELSIDGLVEHGTFEVLGHGSIPIYNGVLGVQGRGEGILVAPIFDPTQEERDSIENAPLVLTAPALVDAWTGDFLNEPVVPYWSREDAYRQSGALSPRPYPDAPGVDGSYGDSCASALWSLEGGVRESLAGVMAAADNYCLRSDAWTLRTGEEIPVYPGRPLLSVDEGYPWSGIEGQTEQNDPRDTLGHDLPRGRAWPGAAGEHETADGQHVTSAPLAAAAFLTNILAYRLCVRRQAILQSYQRSWVTVFGGTDWTPVGRGCARPQSCLLTYCAVDSQIDAQITPLLVRQCEWMEMKIRNRGIPLSRPCVLPALYPGEIAVPYETGLESKQALRIWRKTGSLAALFVAHREGRYVATTCHATRVGPTLDWTFVYWLPVNPNGLAWLPSQGSIYYSGEFLQRWHMAGLQSYLAACAAMSALGLALEQDDPLWAEVAQHGLRELHTLPAGGGSPPELNAYVNQGLPNVDIRVLASRQP